jgi:molybdopterin-guanine dinucleotide biosynthesis protein A
MATGRETIAGLILAGGLGRRLGGLDKALLSVGGQPLVAHSVTRLRPQVAALAISANGDPSRFAPYGLPVLPDTVPGFAGPLAGVLAGLEWARGIGADRLATAAVDTPFFPADLVDRLAAEVRDGAIAVAASGQRRHPTFALVPVTLAGDLAAFLRHGASRSVNDWQARHATVEARFETPGPGGIDPFFNINTEDDRAIAETTT